MSIDSRECYSFPEAWQNRISSVDTYGGCIYAYDSSDCSGRRIQIGPGTQNHNNLDEINFNNKLRSFIQCPLSNVVVHSESTDVWSVALKEHNKYREIHHSPALRGDSSVIFKIYLFHILQIILNFTCNILSYLVFSSTVKLKHLLSI